MDWNLFWTAFGAIGTTLGSLITASAVVVAVIQYKEPLVKRIKITFTSAIPLASEIENRLFRIGVSNTGIRPINISNIYINVGKKNLMINYAQFSLAGVLPPLLFPVELQPEHEIVMYLDEQKIAQYFSDSLAQSKFYANTLVKIAVTDKTGGWHYHSTKLSVKDFAHLAL